MNALDRIAAALEQIAEQGKPSAPLRVRYIASANPAELADHVARVAAWSDKHYGQSVAFFDHTPDQVARAIDARANRLVQLDDDRRRNGDPQHSVDLPGGSVDVAHAEPGADASLEPGTDDAQEGSEPVVRGVDRGRLAGEVARDFAHDGSSRRESDEGNTGGAE